MTIPTLLHATRWLNLLENGGWVYASRRPPGGPAGLDAVNVVALHESAGARRLVVIEEWRRTIQDWEFSLPAGLIEPDESVIEAAARELAEETGFTTTWLGATTGRLFSTAGVTDESFAFVFCGCTGAPAASPGVENERIRVHLLDRAGCRRLLERNAAGLALSGRLWPILHRAATDGKVGAQLLA